LDDSQFRPVAQAGFGAGSRLLQIVLMPAMAMAVAIVPIVGQNFAQLPFRESGDISKSCHTDQCLHAGNDSTPTVVCGFIFGFYQRP
jgi:hypothetical protein